MALYTCPDCGHHVSDAAVSCPGCGRPIRGAALDESMHARGTRTIEATAKSWKLCQLLGTLAIIIGVGFTVGGCSMENERASLIGALSLGPGIFFYVLGRLGAWWFHG